MLITKIDEMVKLVGKSKKINFRDIAKKLGWNENSVEKVALILEKAGLAETHYPIDMIRNPWATVKQVEDEPEEKVSGKELERYTVTGNRKQLRGTVRILDSKDEKRPVYDITLPKVSIYTRAYLEHAKTEVSSGLPLDFLEKDKEESAKHYEVRYSEISKMIEKDLSPDEESLHVLTDLVINEMYGLGKLEALIDDSRLEEVIVNSSSIPVSVYHRTHGWLKSNIMLKDELETENFSGQIARKVGRQISLLSPVLDARLGTGDRANATLFPISAHGNTITLRLFSKNPWTIISFLKKDQNTMSVEMAALLWQAMQYEMNIVIAGGTASGKTSALNSLLALIQPFQRIVSIEDTRELSLPSYQWNWVPLVTRPANPEGAGEVSMLDLVVNSLRMRPDRIVMGEIRRKQEAEVLFEAMHTGHSVYSTLHADTGTQVVKRLTEPPIEVPPVEVEDIHLLLVQYRDRRKNVRRTLELSELVPGPEKPELNRIYNWKARTDTFELVKPPRRYVEQMNLHTGMTDKEVHDDMKRKGKILSWMLKNELESVEDVGKVMKTYYADPDEIAKAAVKGTAPSKVL